MNSANQGTSFPRTVKPVLVEVEWVRKALQGILDNQTIAPALDYCGYEKCEWGVDLLRKGMKTLLNAKELGGKGT